MIEYVEIRGADTNIIGIVDMAASILWHSVYYGVGDFEIYAAITPATVKLLQEGHFVTRTDNKEVGIIEHIEIENNEADGKMIIASGRFVKSILDRRIIYKLAGNTNTATILRGNVESAVREVVKNNAISCDFDNKRNISILGLGKSANIPYVIVDENGNVAQKQVSYENLLTYTDGVLQEYGLSARCELSGGQLLYTIFEGVDRSTTNTGGNLPIVFSQEFDNLTSSNYLYDTTPEKNAALIGGAGEGVERFYSLYEKGRKDLQRRELFVDASSISRTYKDETETEKTYADAEYNTMLITQGIQELTPLVVTETFDGDINITSGNYIFGRDFALGDIVTVQDNDIGKYINVRISEVTEVQDESGYTVEVNYM